MAPKNGPFNLDKYKVDPKINQKSLKIAESQPYSSSEDGNVELEAETKQILDFQTSLNYRQDATDVSNIKSSKLNPSSQSNTKKSCDNELDLHKKSYDDFIKNSKVYREGEDIEMEYINKIEDLMEENRDLKMKLKVK